MGRNFKPTFQTEVNRTQFSSAKKRRIVYCEGLWNTWLTHTLRKSVRHERILGIFVRPHVSSLKLLERIGLSIVLLDEMETGQYRRYKSNYRYVSYLSKTKTPIDFSLTSYDHYAISVPSPSKHEPIVQILRLFPFVRTHGIYNCCGVETAVLRPTFHSPCGPIYALVYPIAPGRCPCLLRVFDGHVGRKIQRD